MQGKTINGFELKKLLGTGGMAEVWYAENKIGKKAAVKLLLPKLGQDENVVSRFLNEAKVMVELDHPNIRQVYDYGDIDGRPAIVMEYLNGSDLKTRMKTGEHFSDEELQRWWNQMVDALNYTHGQDIVHRDIKPSNIFVDAEGNAKLLDFGIAKVRDSISATQTGQKLGTLMYMSPEQVRDPKRVGAASDAYSLAVTFVHLLTGKAPYDSTTDSDYDIQESIVRKPLDLSGVPDEWQDFLNPYLAKNPEDRPALSPFKVVASEAPAKTDESDDEGTIVGDVPKNPEHSNHQRVTPSAASRHSGLDPLSPAPKDDPHSKKGLWISLGIAALVALMLLIFWPKKTTDSTDPDTQAYEACETVEDYRAYMHAYGDRALHYAEAQAFVARWVADSTAKADSLARVMQETLALAQSRQQAEADSIAQAEAEREEEAAYGKCTTIAACEKYLKDYPRGLYVAEVRKKKAELEEQAKPKDVSGSANGHEWVDLGLPSGTLWATCNVGASSPEDYGNYYAWGETSTKTTYEWDTYKYAKDDDSYLLTYLLTKYCTSSSNGYNRFVDNKTILQTGDDAAAVNWGKDWRMPSKEQWEELLANTNNQWTTQKGVKGRLFTSKQNGVKIFLPAAGGVFDDEFGDDGLYGYYWSRSLDTDYFGKIACHFQINSSSCCMTSDDRCVGLSVRPVRKK